MVELLVVIGIIAILLAILLPSLAKARGQANQVACGSNLRQLMLAFRMFADEHEGHLPGGWYDYANVDDWKRDWLMGDSQNYLNAPQNGTLFPYVTGAYKVYRCPALPDSKPRSGEFSNGHFDYALFLSLAGAKIGHVRPETHFTYPDGRVDNVPTPVIVEEDPLHNINTLSLDSGHASSDKMAHHHNGGGNYVAVDGSVHWFKEPLEAATARTTDRWTSQAPSGAWVALGGDWTWGTWENQ